MPTASWRSAPTCRCSATSAARCSATSRPTPCARATSTGTTTATARAAPISHSNDQVLLAPVFHDGRRCGFVMGWAHFSDIGGLRAGSISPDTTDIFQEGIIVPPTKLIDAGHTNEATLKIFFRNSRFPEQNVGDMRALMASAALGVKRIEEIVGALRRRRRGRCACASSWRAPATWCAPSSPRPSTTAPIASPMPSTPTATATARSTCGWR